ncbi:hypothetical protein PLICRDRAFT_187496 [Plicaturopsis crispa FD-325 SS-3]|nr:hypothetical protein PLICRDRAFT_187496 [Plicaturopsis crispa FD-325 SS-3]
MKFDVVLPRPDFGVDNKDFPPLPNILSPEIYLQVFTHRSYFARPTHLFEDHPDDPSPDNEKLEHLGDTVIEFVVTGLILEMYPFLRVGPSTKIRAMMVGNTTLAEISLKYKLPNKLRLHPAQSITLRASNNVQADVFESYVGGLYTDQGLDVAKNWLSPLFRPYAKAAYHIVRTQHGLPALPTPSPSPDPDAPHVQTPARPIPWHPPTLSTQSVGHLAYFNQKVQNDNKVVEWNYSSGAGDGIKTTPIWIVRAIVDSEFVGEGRGNTKKAARNEAAKQGLEKMGIFV